MLPNQKFVLNVKQEIIGQKLQRDVRTSKKNTISLSRHEQVCLIRLRFERYFSHDKRVSLET